MKLYYEIYGWFIRKFSLTNSYLLNYYDTLYLCFTPFTHIHHTHLTPHTSHSSLSDLSGSYIITADHVTSRKDRRVQLSSCILIGPSDAVLNQPIKIKLPHCLSYLNNSWHLQVHTHAPTHILFTHIPTLPLHTHTHTHSHKHTPHTHPLHTSHPPPPPTHTPSQVLGRPYGSPDEDSSWTDITNTMGLVDLPNKKHKTHFKQSTYQMHLDYITVSCHGY